MIYSSETITIIRFSFYIDNIKDSVWANDIKKRQREKGIRMAVYIESDRVYRENAKSFDCMIFQYLISGCPAMVDFYSIALKCFAHRANVKYMSINSAKINVNYLHMYCTIYMCFLCCIKGVFAVG